MSEIQLISVPVDEGAIPIYEDGVFVPLSLIWLGSYLHNHGFQVEIIDGQHTETKEIIDRMNAPVVGLNFNVLSIGSLDEIVRAAKQKGLIVVVGGQAATPLARQLMSNSDIDYVIRHDGEEALRLILEGKQLASIPNLTYRSGTIQDNPVRLLDLAKLPPVTWNFQGIEVARYWKRFDLVKRSIPHHNHQHDRPLSAFTMKGCPYRLGDKGCSFCSRIDTTLRNRTPWQVYDEFRYLVSLGADRIEEFSDSWVYNRKWLQALADIIEQQGHWGVPIRVYADTRHIKDEKLTELMNTIRIDSVILGVESGNDTIMAKNFKPNTVEQVVHCADLLGKAGIKASPSYVFGLIGETKKTIQDTLWIVEEIRNRCEIEMAYFNIMTPLPGSPVWNLLLQDSEMQDKYGNSYNFDFRGLQRDYFERFTDLGRDGVDCLSNMIAEAMESQVVQRDYR